MPPGTLLYYHFLINDGDIAVAADLLRDHSGKALTVNSQCAAGFHSGGLCALEDQAAHTAQLFFQKTYGIFQPVTTQRIGADQLCEIRAVAGFSSCQIDAL